MDSLAEGFILAGKALGVDGVIVSSSTAEQKVSFHGVGIIESNMS